MQNEKETLLENQDNIKMNESKLIELERLDLEFKEYEIFIREYVLKFVKG